MQVKGYEGPVRAVLIDVGTADDFLENQLKPQAFADAAKGNSKVKLELRLQAWPPSLASMTGYCCACTNLIMPSRLMVWGHCQWRVMSRSDVLFAPCSDSTCSWLILKAVLKVAGDACRTATTTPTPSCRPS